MTELTTGLPPAGWYPDRPDATSLRWWDGAHWTDNWHELVPSQSAPDPSSRREATQRTGASVAVLERTDPSPRGVAASIAAVAAVAAASASVAAVEAPVEPQRPRRILSSVDQARIAGGYAPLGHETVDPRQVSFAFDPPRKTSQTLAGWLIALSPMWVGAGAIAALVLLSRWTPIIAQALVGVLAVVLTVALARIDSGRLRDRGYDAPSGWWAVWPLLYFIRRVATAGWASLPMLLSYLLSYAVLGAAVFVLATQTAILVNLDTPAEETDGTVEVQDGATLTDAERAALLSDAGTEAELRSQLEQTWTIGALDCQPFAADVPDATTTCAVELDGARYNAGLQVTPDDPTSAFVITGMLPAQP